MASASDPSKPDAEPSAGSEMADSLPPVEPPSTSFILQLFLIPLIIVSIIVMVWLTFSWLAQAGSNPRDLVDRLERGDPAAWQRAGILADMLRDQRKQHLRRDTELAARLASVLTREIEEGGTSSQSPNPNQINLRIFICRALGEFLVPDVLPALLLAASTERDAASIEPPGSDYDTRRLTELDVRRAALEAIAILRTNIDDDQFDPVLEDQLMDILITASRERGDPGRDEHVRRELRSTAAFVLGVLGSGEALDRLEVLLDDANANTRFNAATGLARHGDIRAVPELIDMLDPENADAVEDEVHQSGIQFKRSLVITSGILAATTLAEQNESDDLSELRTALLQLSKEDVPASVRLKAKDAVNIFDQRGQAMTTP